MVKPSATEDDEILKYMEKFNQLYDSSAYQKTSMEQQQQKYVQQQQKMEKRRIQREQREMYEGKKREKRLEMRHRGVTAEDDSSLTQPHNSPVDETEELAPPGFILIYKILNTHFKNKCFWPCCNISHHVLL